MTAGIVLPAAVGPVPDLRSTPTGASALTADLRATCLAVKDAQGWAAGNGAPSWAGQAGDAHDHAMTRFAARADPVEAALERALTAGDRFADRLTRLVARRAPLLAERADLDDAIAALRADVAGATETDPSRVEELRRRAERLSTRATRLRADIDEWTASRDEADADFVAALGRVDSVGEGARAADAPGRPDTDGLLDRLDRLAGDPLATAAWWGALTRAQRQALIAEHPGRVGSAGGVPAADRDQANRAALDHDRDRLGQREAEGRLTPAERRVLENARAVQQGLDDLRHVVDPHTGLPLAQLLVYAPAAHGGDGGVAVGIGDPDTADHVSVTVPGLTTESTSLPGAVDRLIDLHERSVDAGSGSVATLYWADYDAPSGNPLVPWEVPDLAGAALTAAADAGGERLGDFLDGLRAGDQGAPAHLSAVGHSYGSTTLGHALEDGAAVDEAVLVGSPGQPVSSAGELTGGDVWVGSMDHDPVTLLGSGERGGLGVLGHDPAAEDFGGRRFATGDGELRVEELLDNHSSYFEGVSLDNIAHVVTGNEALVTDQPHRGEEGGDHATLEELLVEATAASGADWLHDRAADLGALLRDALSHPSADLGDPLLGRVAR